MSQFNLDVTSYSNRELEQLINLPTKYTREEVAIRVEDFKVKLVKSGGGSTESVVDFLTHLAGRLSVQFEKLPSTVDANSRSMGEHAIAVDHSRSTPHPGSAHRTSRIVNVDSLFRKNVFPFDAANPRALTSSTNYTFDLSHPLTNVTNMRLHSVHIPTTWYAFAPEYGNTRFYYEGNPVDISAGNYTPSELLAEVDAKMVAQSGVSNPKYDFAVSQYKTEITHNNGSGIHSFTWYDHNDADHNFSEGTGTCGQRTKVNNSLGWALGFRRDTDPVQYDIDGSSTITSEAAIDTFGPRYFYLVIDDYTNSQTSQGLVSINDINPTTQELNDATNSWKNDRVRPPSERNVIAIISIDNPSTFVRGVTPFIRSGLEFNSRSYSSPVDIDRMHVSLIDDRGATVNLNGGDWSFTLIVDQEI